MKGRFDDYNKSFKRAERKVGFGVVMYVLFKVVFIGLLVYGIIRISQELNEQNSSIMKETGKVIKNMKDDFNEGLVGDTLVIDTLKIK
jgi:hypothetical protein